MENECHFCRGIVSLRERTDIVLDCQGDHRIYMHKQCAAGHGLVEDTDDPENGTVRIACPNCGTIETR